MGLDWLAMCVFQESCMFLSVQWENKSCLESTGVVKLVIVVEKYVIANM